MSLLTERLGYARTATVELDTFTRICKGQFYDNEEIRKFYSGAYEYICIAPIGSAISDPVWNSVRVTWLNNRKIRMQYQENMTYSDITNGWIL